MNIGYACLALAVPDTTIRTCRLANANHERLLEISKDNLQALERLLIYSSKRNIRLFRISSDMIPFASSDKVNIPWQKHFKQELSTLGQFARNNHIRLSMHPGQYTVLNSPDSKVHEQAVAELCYHADFLTALGMGSDCKLILHVGGVYGDKDRAKARFVERAKDLDKRIKDRLVIENDERCFHIADVLEISAKTGLPVVFDNLHHRINPPLASGTDLDWICRALGTWKDMDGQPKIHYSQQALGQRLGAHTQTIAAPEFLTFYQALGERVATENSLKTPDIMLEVKDKNISAVKLIACLQGDKTPKLLEEEWARYKYLLMERAPESYSRIRHSMPLEPIKFYDLIDQGRFQVPKAGAAVNAAEHVWGYYRGKATTKEKDQYQRLLQGYSQGTRSLESLKNYLYKLALTYKQDYLLDSYYFSL